MNFQTIFSKALRAKMLGEAFWIPFILFVCVLKPMSPSGIQLSAYYETTRIILGNYLGNIYSKIIFFNLCLTHKTKEVHIGIPNKMVSHDQNRMFERTLRTVKILWTKSSFKLRLVMEGPFFSRCNQIQTNAYFARRNQKLTKPGLVLGLWLRF